MTNYFNSGLYDSFCDKQFYKEHDIDFRTNTDDYYNIEYNRELLAAYYKIRSDRYNNDEHADSANYEQWERVDDKFREALNCWQIYFEPMIFNEEIALECKLIPFTYQGVGMLALAGYGMDFSPRLDTYQVLTHNTVDQYSRLVRANKYDDYFEYVVGKDMMKKVLKAIA